MSYYEKLLKEKNIKLGRMERNARAADKADAKKRFKLQRAERQRKKDKTL